MRITDRAEPGMTANGPADARGERDFVDEVVQDWAHEWPGDDLLWVALESRLLRLAFLSERFRLEQLRAMGLSRGEYFILTTLRRSSSPYAMTAGALARSILNTTTNISPALRRLEGRGFIRRELHPDDRRSIVVSLTEAGRRCVDDVRGTGAQFSDVFSALTNEERVQLSALMKKALLALDDRPVKEDIEG